MESFPPHRPGTWPKPPGWLVLALMLANLAGCRSGSQHKPAGDPLLGVPTVSPIPATPASQTTQFKKGGIPPLPVAQSSSANAALASLPGENRMLAIDPPLATSFPKQPTPGQLATVQPPPGTLTSQPGGFPAPQAALTPKVMQVPRADSTSPVVPVGSFSAGVQTQEILQSQLKARGVQWQKQEVVAEGIRFTCIAPNRSNPDSSRIYEATAPDYAAAVQAILLQIDQPQ